MSYSSSINLSCPRIGHSELVHFTIEPHDMVLMVTAIHPDLAFEISGDFIQAQDQAIKRHNIRDPRCMAFKYTVYELTDQYGLIAGEVSDTRIMISGTPAALFALRAVLPTHYLAEELDYQDVADDFGIQLGTPSFGFATLS